MCSQVSNWQYASIGSDNGLAPIIGDKPLSEPMMVKLLTHLCSLSLNVPNLYHPMMPCGDNDIGQQWFRYWLVGTKLFPEPILTRDNRGPFQCNFTEKSQYMLEKYNLKLFSKEFYNFSKMQRVIGFCFHFRQAWLLLVRMLKEYLEYDFEWLLYQHILRPVFCVIAWGWALKI